MGEHSPSPTPERAIYGFVLYVASYLLFGLYILWAYLPESWLNKIGITYLPQRFWVFAGPLYMCIALVVVVCFYISWNLIHTPSMDSMSTITDEYARVLPEEASTTSLCKNQSVPPLGDIDIRMVNRCLYPRPDKGETLTNC